MVTGGAILSSRYLIKQEVGVGGMGAVYEATDLRTGAQVAVKVLHPMYARNPDYVKRLRREAQIAASIRTPRAVRVIDLDDHDGMPYLVMEYVAGENLSDKLDREGRLSVDEALSICTDITRALEGAHAVGVVHRDLKPQNVKITEEGEVKVLDFGIARADSMPGITGTNMFTGTPEYCAPERIDGPGDIRSDIYAVGIMLYEMLAGQRPFDAPTAFAMLRRHESAPVPPLPVEVPPQVREILDRSLAKRPEDRYQTPSDLMAALRAARGLAPIGAAATPPADRLVPETVARAPVPAQRDDTPLVGPTVVQPGARTVTRPPGMDGPTGGTGPAGATVARGPDRRLWLIGSAVAVLALAGGAAFALTRGGSSPGPGPDTATARGTNISATPVRTATASGTTPTAGPATVAARPLLAPGEKLSLNAASEIILPVCLDANKKPAVTSVLTVTSVERAADSRRVTVAYRVRVPRVAGIECALDYAPDSEGRVISLQTRQQSGNIVSAPLAGGTGAGITSEKNVYGREFGGTWIFDNVELEGRELTLVQEDRAADGGSAGVAHAIKLVSR